MDYVPKPNRGSAIPDSIAVGRESETLETWRKREGITPDGQIRLVRLVHMRYQHPNLDEITVFLQDFGMSVAKRTNDEAWFRGYGTDPYVYYARKGPKKFLGGTFEVESFAELEKASKLSTSSKIEEQVNAPGEGFLLTLTDPEGYPVNLIYGQKPAEPGDYPEKIIFNYEIEKPRVRKFNRFTPGPAAVHKLGHFGLCVQDFQGQLDFYVRNFNIVPSDFLFVDQDSGRRIVAVFAHIDRGETLVDHHSFFMSTNPTSHVHHCSFEVHDFDTQQLGHQFLAKRGYRPVWGVGRHILGSQIFDYWWDPNSNMIEHYTDGDLVNNETPIGYGPAGHESLAVWGPEVPSWFLE